MEILLFHIYQSQICPLRDWIRIGNSNMEKKYPKAEISHTFVYFTFLLYRIWMTRPGDDSLNVSMCHSLTKRRARRSWGVCWRRRSTTSGTSGYLQIKTTVVTWITDQLLFRLRFLVPSKRVTSFWSTTLYNNKKFCKLFFNYLSSWRAKKTFFHSKCFRNI